MQPNTRCDDLPGAVYSFLAERVRVAQAQGVERVAVDPGLGFGKSLEDNLALLGMLECFSRLEHPLVVGASRKSFIWRTLGLSAAESLEGSLAAAALAARAGVHILRVHDVVATLRAVRFVEAVRGQAPC